MIDIGYPDRVFVRELSRLQHRGYYKFQELVELVLTRDVALQEILERMCDPESPLAGMKVPPTTFPSLKDAITEFVTRADRIAWFHLIRDCIRFTERVLDAKLPGNLEALEGLFNATTAAFEGDSEEEDDEEQRICFLVVHACRTALED